MTLLINSNKFYAINPGDTKKLGFKVSKTNFKAQKIDSSILKTFKMIIANFLVKNKINKPRFF